MTVLGAIQYDKQGVVTKITDEKGKIFTGSEAAAYVDRETLGPVPWQCWDIPGFKSCNTEAGHRAHRELANQGIYPDSEIYKKFYPLFLRLEIFGCQTSFGCYPSLVRALTEMTQASEARTVTDPVSLSSRWKTYAISGLGLVAALYLFKRMTRA
jgi:hypothetical protein